MKVYVRVVAEEGVTHRSSWYHTDGLESYIADSQDLFEKENLCGEIYVKGTAFKSWKSAKQAAKKAKAMAAFNGWGKATVTFWKRAPDPSVALVQVKPPKAKRK